MLVHSMTLGPVATNCYLAVDEPTGIGAIIDPGDNGSSIARTCVESGYKFDKILLTHTHFDHINGVPELLRDLDPSLPIYIHKLDYPADNVGFGRPPDLERFKDQIIFIDEGDTIPIGDATATVLHTPGHTPGGVCFQVEDLLFTGDTLFCGSCGRTDFPSSSPEDMLRSLARLGRLGVNYQILPGHDRISELGQELKYNYFMRYAMQQGY